jgi:coproporphyrinogen III oxidase-like Fe-S oxidoreductase
VDLIYGLPGQTLEGLLSDIRTLAAVGVDGFSLYELQLSSRNAKFARQHGLDRRDRRLNYLYGQVASRQLVAAGFRKTLFNHFAAAHDTNLYFTFPERGEDCLALGASADGVFADYHYRHPEYSAYGRAVDGGFPGLEGGLRRSELENRLQPLTSALMAGRVPPSLFDDVTSQALLHHWRQALLLIEDSQSGDLALTGSGSWFVGNMLSQLAESYVAAEEMAGDDERQGA